MITSSTPSNIVTSPTAGTAFNLQADSYLFDLLTSKVYSNPIAAAIREISTNAIDACIEAGVTPTIDVHLPTSSEPYFSVRDHGIGMSPDTIADLYSTVGASSKRSSNNFNGCMGIGKLAPLAYTTSFQVTSYYGNQEHSYLVTLQNSIPTLVHLLSAPSDQPSGLLVTFQVNPEDCQAFTITATDIYRWFSTAINLNIPLSMYIPDYCELTPDIIIYKKSSGVLMGNVLYSVPQGVTNLHHLPYNVIFKADIGEVSINPGRELLSCDESTINWLNSKIEDFKSNINSYIKQKLLFLPTEAERCIAAYHYDSLLNTAYVFDRHSAIISPSLYNGTITLPNTAQLYQGFRWKSTVSAFKSHQIKLMNLFDSPIYVNDTLQSSKLSSLIPAKSNFLVLRKADKTPLNTFVADIIAFLNTFGLTYTLCSTIFPTKETAVKPPVDLSKILINDVYSGTSVSKPYPCDTTNQYYYIPVSGATFAEKGSKTEALYSAFQLLLSTGQPYPQLVGVNKRCQELIKDHPNFTLFEDVVQSLLNEYTFISYPTEERSTIETITVGGTSYASRPRFTNPTSAIASVYTIHDKKYQYEDLSAHIATAATSYTFKYFEIRSPITADDFHTKYPLLSSYSSRFFSVEHLDRYLELETHYDSTPLITRQHAYVNLADPHDNDYTFPPELLENP